jgi:hypothetical protein
MWLRIGCHKHLGSVKYVEFDKPSDSHFFTKDRATLSSLYHVHEYKGRVYFRVE